MLQFAVGFYACGFIMTSSLVYIALEQEKPKLSPAKRIAVSAALGLGWLVLGPWICRRAWRRAQQGNDG